MNISTDNLIKFLTTLGLAAIIFSVSFWYYLTDAQIEKGLKNHLERSDLKADLWQLDILRNEIENSLPYNSYNSKSYQVYQFKEKTEYLNALSNVYLIWYTAKIDSNVKSKIDSLNNISLQVVKKKLKKIEYDFDEKLRSKNSLIIKTCLIILGLIGVFIFCGGVFFWYKNDFKNKTTANTYIREKN